MTGRAGCSVGAGTQVRGFVLFTLPSTRPALLLGAIGLLPGNEVSK